MAKKKMCRHYDDDTEIVRMMCHCGDISRKCPRNTNSKCEIVPKKPNYKAENKVYRGFRDRVLTALKPGTKLWQKAHNEPLTWPDPIRLIGWLTGEARHKGR